MQAQVPFVAITLDQSRLVAAWNDRAERLFATSRDAAIGRPISELLPVRGGAEAWRTALAGSSDAPQILVVDHPTAGERHLEAWVQPSGEAVTIYAHDVTARAAGERWRALESAMLSALKNSLDLVVLAIDRQGTLLTQEGKGLAAAGMTENQLVGMNLFELYGEVSDVSLVHDAIAGKLRHSSPDATNAVHGHLWENWFVPVEDPVSGASVVAISLNVTEARRREEELRTKLDLIERQREVIRELSTPIIEVWDGVLTLPIVGLVDSVRTAELMDNLLDAVSRTRARFAILDLTGVQVVDTSTASHLIGLIQAIRLLGAEGVLTGIHPNIAQTIVAIGVDLSRVRVFSTLREALKHSIAQMTRRA